MKTEERIDKYIGEAKAILPSKAKANVFKEIDKMEKLFRDYEKRTGTNIYSSLMALKKAKESIDTSILYLA